MMSPDTKIARDVRRLLRVLVVLTAVLYLALLGLFVWTRHDASATSHALCALRTDLQTRVQSSRDFLRSNPNGIPGIPVSVIQDSIVNQESSIRALSSLSC